MTLRQVKEQGMSALVVSHLDIKEPLKDALEQVPGCFLLEQSILQQLDTLQENLQKQSDWTSFLDTAGLAFIQCVYKSNCLPAKAAASDSNPSAAPEHPSVCTG